MNRNDCASLIEAGNSYLETARNGHRRGSVFTGTMIYHVVCLSIEKYLMGIFCCYNAIPQHNTLSRMAQEAADFADLPSDLLQAIEAMDGVLNLCDPATPLQATLTGKQLQAMIQVGEQLRDLASAHLPCAA
ncbi:hypothetical protein [Desulfosarcina ovata]|uniref:HEPN domain-containing protein n=2 Tax=Desulfosarcina ovata TaxID=83564 RepID=A0A5K8AHU8_9BACT|nr:hypothetical protein [Desulfosarcina ovata]BBO85358.1 hypothetical protein DSCO28_59240 [Desulfosarcina ovata subsp. sediminis]BBO92262.1 hypothetical protein DSCOOX_54420 [Desulfosarcina ovata subsp. ovata]